MAAIHQDERVADRAITLAMRAALAAAAGKPASTPETRPVFDEMTARAPSADHVALSRDSGSGDPRAEVAGRVCEAHVWKGMTHGFVQPDAGAAGMRRAIAVRSRAAALGKGKAG